MSYHIQGQLETESVIFIPKIGDYVLCSLKECFVQWPSSVPVVKYYVGQVLSVKGKISIKLNYILFTPSLTLKTCR